MSRAIIAVLVATLVLFAPPVRAVGGAFDRQSRLVELFLLYIARPHAESKIDINESSAEEIERSLVAVDAQTAEATVQARERNGRFNSLLDLLDVPGWSRRSVMVNRHRITFSSP